MKKTILMILNQKFLFDERVELQYKALKESGYDIYVLASEQGENSESFNIIRLSSLNSFKTKIGKVFFRVNKNLIKEIKSKLSLNGVNKIDVIHVHDLLWSFLGFELQKIFNSKILIDFHENYPEYIYDTTNQMKWFNIKKYLRLLFFNRKRLKNYEHRSLISTDAFINVVPEALNRFKDQEYFSKGVIVSNTKDPGNYEFSKIPEIKDKLKITYIGTIQELRGLETAIEGMVNLDSKFELNIVGLKDDEYCNSLRKFVARTTTGNINLINWTTDKKIINQYYLNSHVVLIPHNKTNLTLTTIPNKIFVSMAMGRPLLVSDVAPLKRVITDCQSGLVFKAGSSDDFAKKVSQLYDYNKLSEFSLNGKKAVESKYNWTTDKNRLLNLYKKLTLEEV